MAQTGDELTLSKMIRFVYLYLGTGLVFNDLHDLHAI